MRQIICYKVGQLSDKVEQVLQSSAVRLRGIMTNGDPCLLLGILQFESGVI